MILSAVFVACCYFVVALALFRDSLAWVDQAVNWDVAAELNQQLVQAHTAEERADVFRRLELVNPWVRGYLVTSTGTVARGLLPKWEVRRARIDLLPIAGALSLSSLRSLWLVEDPGAREGSAEFSVTRASFTHEGRVVDGFLLVVLHHPALEAFRGPNRFGRFIEPLFPSLAAILCGGIVACLSFWLAYKRALGRVDHELESAEVTPLRRGNDFLPADEASALADEIRELKRELHERKAAVSERTGRRKEMILNIVHDIRIPVTSVLGFLEMFLRQKKQLVASESASSLKTIGRGLEHQRALLDDLTLLTELDGGLRAGAVEPVSLPSIAERSIEDFRATAAVVGVTMQLERSGDVPELELRPVLIKRAVYNLVSNALKFTPPGGTVTIEVFRRDQEVEVGVRDTGIGIAKEEQSRIFEDFYRVRSSAAKEGTGIGLAIVRRVIELHHGRLGVESEEGKGTRIFFALPLAPIATVADVPPSVPKEVPWQVRAAELFRVHAPMFVALVAFSAVLSSWEAPPLFRIGALVPALWLFLRPGALRGERPYERRALQLASGSAIGVLIRESSMVIIGPPGPVLGFICGALGSLVYRNTLLRSMYTFTPIVIAVVQAMMWKREQGVFTVGVGAGLCVSVLDLAIVALRARRLIALRFAGIFLCCICSGFAFSAVLTSVNLRSYWDRQMLAIQRDIADGVTTYLRETGRTIELDALRRSERERAFLPLSLLGPNLDFLIVTDDCAGFFPISLQARVNSRYTELYSGMDIGKKGCREELIRAIANEIPLSFASTDLRSSIPARLAVVLRPWINTKLSLNLCQQALIYTSIASLLLTLASCVLLFSRIRRKLGEPLAQELERVRELRRTLTDETAESVPPFRGNDALERIAVDMVEGARLLRAEDEKRRAFVTALTGQLHPLLGVLESECGAALRRAGDEAIPRGQVQQMFDAALLQSQILRTIFEVVKIESRAVAIDREPLELGDLIEDAVIGCGVLYSARGISIDLDLPPGGSEIEADLRLLELMFDSLLRAIYFWVRPESELRIEVTADAEMVSGVFRFTETALEGWHPVSSPLRSESIKREDLRLELPDVILQLHGERPMSFHSDGAETVLRFSFRRSIPVPSGASYHRYSSSTSVGAQSA